MHRRQNVLHRLLGDCEDLAGRPGLHLHNLLVPEHGLLLEEGVAEVVVERRRRLIHVGLPLHPPRDPNSAEDAMDKDDVERRLFVDFSARVQRVKLGTVDEARRVELVEIVERSGSEHLDAQVGVLLPVGQQVNPSALEEEVDDVVL